MNQQFAHLPTDKKIYLASDFHLGVPTHAQSLQRERKIIRWLDKIEKDAAALILVGDIFDFWFEYKHVVPKGYIRFLGKLADLRDKGIPILFFTGNHDLWMFDYFEKELDIPIIRKPTSFLMGGRKILIGHGDGLGPGDKKFKAIKQVFKNRIAQWGFGWLHPNVGFGLATYWSQKSKDKGDPPFQGEGEWLLQHCREVEKTIHHDYYIFGHRHLPLEMQVNESATYLNLGDWFEKATYIEVTQHQVTLQYFED